MSSNPRIPYQLSSARPKLAQPGGKPLIVHLVVNVEHWQFDQGMPAQLSNTTQDVFDISIVSPVDENQPFVGRDEITRSKVNPDIEEVVEDLKGFALRSLVKLR